MNAREFQPRGLGYALVVPDVMVEVNVRRLVRTRGELHGEVSVDCGLPGTKLVDGHVHQARFNLSSTRSRTDLARTLTARTNVPDIDWADILEDFCRRVMAADSEGEPVTMVGARPRPVSRPYRLDPMLPLGDPVILYGEGGTGKSTLAAAIAVSIETGAVIVPGFIPRQAPVLYLDWESGPDAINERVAAIGAGAFLPRPAEIRYRLMTRPLSDVTEDLAAYITRERVGLVIVDSVGLASGISDGGDAAETAWRLFAAFRHMRTNVLAIDHIAKASADEPTKASRPYGSVYKTNLARATFELRRMDDTNGATLGLYNTKFNDRKRLAPIALAVAHEDDRIVYERLDDLPEELTKSLGLADRMAAVMAFQALLPNDIAELVDAKPQVVREYLRRGQGKRFTKDPSGRWEVIGREASRAAS